MAVGSLAGGAAVDFDTDEFELLVPAGNSVWLPVRCTRHPGLESDTAFIFVNDIDDKTLEIILIRLVYEDEE